MTNNVLYPVARSVHASGMNYSFLEVYVTSEHTATSLFRRLSFLLYATGTVQQPLQKDRLLSWIF